MSQVQPQSVKSEPVVTRIGAPITYHGYAWGVRQPSLQYAVHCKKSDEPALLQMDAVFARVLGQDAAALPPDFNQDPVVRRLLQWPTAILRAGSHPVLQPTRAAMTQRTGAPVHLIQQPCLNHVAAAHVVNFVISALNLFGADASAAQIVGNTATNLGNLINSLKQAGLRGFNPEWFLLAADELRVPWAQLRGEIYLFGWGAKGRWLQSSFSDQTSKIGTALARNKVDGAAVLRSNGVPVAPHFAVRNEQEAVEAAENLGYPVVVKPIDLDGGKGVWVNLRSAAAVREAYANAVPLSKLILVEKHVNGRDFRIQVVHGEVHGVLERVPGGVTGTGLDSVRVLLERQNLERKEAADDRRFLHEIANDQEALGLLVEQGLDWDSVPNAGRFVRLRSASNVASGGVPTPQALDQVHPDNLSLAVRAARLLRLDVAGVDLLIPDIGLSWMEGGASVCEVNAQPQMFTTMHKPMLASLLGGTDGRIPVAIVVSAHAARDGAGRALHRDLLGKGVHAGLVCGTQVHVGGQLVCKDAAGAFAGTRMLCNDQSVEAMVICVSDKSVLRQGWPVDRCDVLVLDTRPSVAVDPASTSTDGLAWLGFSAPLAPRRVIVDVSDSVLLAKAKAVFAATSIVESASLDNQLILDAGVAELMTPSKQKP